MSKRVHMRGRSCIPSVNLWRDRPLCLVAVGEAIGECSRVVCCPLATIRGIFLCTLYSGMDVVQKRVSKFADRIRDVVRTYYN